MTDIAVIVLVGKEELHIKRCLEKLAPLEPRQIVIVESQPGDNTHEIAVMTGTELGWQLCDCSDCSDCSIVDGGAVGNSFEDAVVRSAHNEDQSTNRPIKQSNKSQLLTVFHVWPGNQARQFNWALDNLPIAATWCLRLDADEYLTLETVEKMRELFECSDCLDCSIAVNKEGNTLAATSVRGECQSNNRTIEQSNNLPPPADLYTLELKHTFMGGEIRHGTAGIRIPRLFRFGKARYGEAIMDERLVTDGETADFDGAFYDDNLNSFAWWQEKHRGYAKREAQQVLVGNFHDPRKAKYYKLPPYFRAFAYFCLRYFVKLGFLDGLAGFRWHFWQGLWYRCLVDKEIARLKKLPLNLSKPPKLT